MESDSTVANHRDRFNNNPILMACTYGRIDIAKYFLQLSNNYGKTNNNFSLDYKNDEGWNAAFQAIYCNRF